MIDVHSHIIPFIDDGSPSYEESFKLLDEELNFGVTDIILTPHVLRVNLKKYEKPELIKLYQEFIEQTKIKYPINFYLGQEIAYHPTMIEKLARDELLSMNGTEYILLELPFGEMIEDFEELVFNCNAIGKKIVIAHVERYEYLKYKDILNLKKFGVLFQTNASSIVSSRDRNIQKTAHKLLKDKLISFIASDIHSFRINEIKNAFQFVSEKFGKAYAEDLFINNAKKIFKLK